MFFFAQTGNNSSPAETQVKRERPDVFAEVNSAAFLERLRQAGPDSQKAFARLVRLTHDRFLAFARRSLSSIEECQEVVQETYLAVHKGLPGFQGKSRLTTWIYSLCHNKILDRISDRNRNHRELTEAMQHATRESPEPWETLTAWDGSPDQVLALSSIRTLIIEAVQRLPQAAGEVYHLRDEEGLSGEDAAAILNISPVNVRVLLHRARRLIVDHVQERLRQGGVREVSQT